MATSQIYILIAIASLAVIFVIFLLVNPRKKSVKFTALAAIAFCFVVSGTVIGEGRWLGYGLMGTGIVLAIVDIFRSTRRRKSMEQ